MKLKAGGKAVIIAAVVGAIGYGANKMGYFDSAPVVASSIPSNINIDVATPKDPAPQGVSTVAIGKASSAGVINVMTIPWNTNSGLTYANGGQTTASGSLMDKRGLKVNVQRQDDYSQMISAHVAFAKAFAGGENFPKDGIAFSVIMGSGVPGYIASAKEAMGKLGQDLVVVGSGGYSRGEDRCMMPASVKANPQKARGILVAGVPRDGDIHVCLTWAQDNGIPFNANPKVYDPNALNIVETSSFVDADEKLISGATETRPVVENGKLTGERRSVQVTGTATWTPGDIKVVTECSKPGSKCAGIASVASTLEYRWMMPQAIIGNKQWMEKNPEIVQNYLAAVFEGGEIVRNDDSALRKAAGFNAKVFNEGDADYWAKAFKGYSINGVPVGGSTTNGLGDNAFLFGLNGNDNVYKRVYTVYGNLDKGYYPDVMPTLLPYEQAVDTRYLEALLANAKTVTKADVPTFTPEAPKTTVARKAYNIEFQSGKTSFTPEAAAVLDDLLNQLSLSGMMVQINGHTDNVGNADANMKLSKARAEAVKNWLMSNASSTFPSERVSTRGYGDSVPVADNKSAAGRAQNRRVEIVLQAAN